LWRITRFIFVAEPSKLPDVGIRDFEYMNASALHYNCPYLAPFLRYGVILVKIADFNLPPTCIWCPR